MKKNNGYILFIVIVITIILVSVTMIVTMLSNSYSNDIISDSQRNKSYYISQAGLEIVYAALNEQYGGNPSLIAEAGSGEFDVEREKIIEKQNLKIENINKTQVLGYADIYVDLKKLTNGDKWYYRIVSKGKISKDDNLNKPTDTHILTMFVFKDEPNNPKVYEGDKKDI